MGTPKSYWFSHSKHFWMISRYPHDLGKLHEVGGKDEQVVKIDFSQLSYRANMSEI